MTTASFRPTLERARAALGHLRVGKVLHLFGGTDLLVSDDERPVEELQVAAVVVRASATVELILEEELEIAATRRSALASGGERVVLAVTEPGRCSTCDLAGFVGGRIPCRRCGGVGTIEVTEVVVDLDGLEHRRRSTVTCPDCGGACSVPCPTCGGTLSTVRARTRRTELQARAFQHVYVPPLRLPNDAALTALFEDVTPPAALRLAVGGAEAPPDDGSLEGFDFGDRASLAAAAIDRMLSGGTVVRSDCLVFAWPLLVLRAGEAEAVLLVDSSFRLRSFVDE